jgi:hypothetical protein
VWQFILHAQENALEIYVEDAIPRGFGVLGEWYEGVTFDAGIVEGEIETPILLNGLGDKCLDIFGLCHVSLDKERLAAGGLALAVTMIGIVLAASTGVVGASLILLSTLALRPMLASGYRHDLAIGTIMASGCLGILIPPSIMLIVMGSNSWCRWATSSWRPSSRASFSVGFTRSTS